MKNKAEMEDGIKSDVNDINGLKSVIKRYKQT